MSRDLPKVFLSKWLALATQLGLTVAKSRAIGDYLLAQYSGADRHYHGVRHIVSMLDGVELLQAKFEQPLAAELAIFFHDVIYDPARTDNEEQSAAVMKERFQGVLNEATLASAAFSILSTKHHVSTINKDTNLVIDLDMAILGQSWEVYERYAEGVMREYLPVYGEEAYREGRPKLFLEPTIARGDIYLEDEFKHLNEPAIRNMQREAKILKSGQFIE